MSHGGRNGREGEGPFTVSTKPGAWGQEWARGHGAMGPRALGGKGGKGWGRACHMG